jgi:hypothetical protein
MELLMGLRGRRDWNTRSPGAIGGIINGPKGKEGARQLLNWQARPVDEIREGATAICQSAGTTYRRIVNRLTGEGATVTRQPAGAIDEIINGHRRKARRRGKSKDGERARMGKERWREGRLSHIGNKFNRYVFRIC